MPKKCLNHPDIFPLVYVYVCVCVCVCWIDLNADAKFYLFR